MPDKIIEGMIPPLVVPFDERENIDQEAFRTEVRYLYEANVDGISSGGSTGEGAVLSDDELRRCLEIVAEENDVDLIVVASRGLSGSFRNMCTSVTARLLQRFDRPILLILYENDE